jgi:murein DD-endopeptidase MepM/ murein hydrolase activator NlpD
MKKKSINRPSDFTFMIVPHAANKSSFALKIKSRWVYLGIALFVLTVFVSTSSLVYSLNVSRRLVHYQMTLADNDFKEDQISFFDKQTADLETSIRELMALDFEIRHTLGLKPKKTKFDLSQANKNIGSKTLKVNHDIEVLQKEVKSRKESLENLQARVNEIRNRYVYTPSIWPVQGRIISGFGYRTYPWREFHAGVDISSGYGTPIRAAASGTVAFSGWRGGYGKCVIVNHGSGNSSLYGHSSKILVTNGQSVKKGQIIAYVGNTGRSTGPHLHYEVRRNGQPINPVAYLNLDMVTASRIWNR